MATASSSRRLAALLAAVLAGGPVRADAAEAPAERKILIVPPAIEGAMPDNIRAQLGDAFAKSIGAETAPPGTAGCSDAACWQQRARELGASHLVVLRIAVDDRDYAVQADLLDGATGTAIASAERRCEICGYDEVSATVEDVGGLLRRKLGAAAADLPVLAVTSNPSGALVTLDGDRVGTTPLTLKVSPGQHDVRVSKDGYIAKLERVAMVEGVREEVALTLAVAPAGERKRRASGMTIAGASMTVLGLAGIGVGAGVAALDEKPIESRCGGDNRDIEGNCKYRYDSLAAGVTVAVLGGAALVTGVVLLAVDAKRKRTRSKVAVQPSGYGLAIRF